MPWSRNCQLKQLNFNFGATFSTNNSVSTISIFLIWVSNLGSETLQGILITNSKTKANANDNVGAGTTNNDNSISSSNVNTNTDAGTRTNTNTSTSIAVKTDINVNINAKYIVKNHFLMTLYIGTATLGNNLTILLATM